MNLTGQHLLFYDGKCGLCDRAAQFVLKHDAREIFVFAPLQGETAKKLLKDEPEHIKTADSLILIENYQSPKRKYYIYGKGAFRICWLLGGIFKILGTLSWLPSFLYDWIYKIIAKNRRHLFASRCIILTPETKHRFLP